MSELREAALRYLPRSLPLSGKRPLVPDWPRAIATPELVHEWWQRWPDANVGVRTGGGLAVLDVDPRDGGHETLAALEARHGPLPASPEVVTGGDGRHCYFRGPTRMASARIGPGLELKGDGAQVVAPPSIHPASGRLYVWRPGRPFDPCALAALPTWLRPAPPVRPAAGAARPEEDPVRAIPARQFVPELTGRPLDRRGYARCPFHGDGQERTPSLLAGGRDPSLWHCFGCGAGGSVYDLAARLAGYALPLRGAAFLTVRDGLLDHYEFSRQVAA